MSGGFSQLRAELDTFALKHELTPREHDVMFLLISGFSSVAQIADRLNLSQNTIHNHFKNVFRRTSTNSKAGLLSLFIRDTMHKHAAVGPFIKRPKVLLIDPSDQTRQSAAATLRQRGLTVIEEPDLSLTVARIAEHMVDTVVIDESAGGDPGKSLGQVKEKYGDSVAVLIASDGGTTPASVWLARGAAGVFEKPLSADRVMFSILENFVDSPYEHNRFVRVEAQLPVSIDDRQVSTDNIGYGGAFLPMPEDELASGSLDIGSHVRISIDLDSDGTVDTRGEVVWMRRKGRPSSRSGVGVRFMDLSDQDRTTVEEYVRQRKLQGFMPWQDDRDARDSTGS